MKNVRLQHIADRTGISVGNLAYHYRDKKQLLQKLEKKIGVEVANQSSNWKNSTHLIDFDNRLIQLYHLMNRYSFYFLDALELQRSYPTLHLKRIEYIDILISEIESWLVLNVELDFVKPEDNPGDYFKIAEMIWFISAFWLTKNKIINKPDDNEISFREAVWSQIIPYFSQKASVEYEVLIKPKLHF